MNLLNHDAMSRGAEDVPGGEAPPLKILFVSQYFFPESFSVNEIAQELKGRGHELHVISAVPNYGRDSFFPGYSNSLNRQETWRGIQVDRAFTVPRGQRKSAQLALNFAVFPITGIWTYLRRRLWRPDVIFVSTTSPVMQAIVASFVKRFWKAPVVHWIQDFWPDSAVETLNLRSPLIVRPLTAMSGWLYRNADIVLVQSKAFVPLLQKMGVGEDRIRYFPNTAPPMFRPLSREQAPDMGRHFNRNRFNLLFAGNIGGSQDFDTLIAATELLKGKVDLQWVVAGSGLDLERVTREVKARGLEDCFSFIGRLPSDKMPELFAHADAVVVSLRDNHLFSLTVPYKVQCYLACGRPIIASLSGEGAKLLKESGAALVAPASSPRDLAAVVAEMADLDEASRRKMGELGREFFERNFSEQIVYGILEKALRDAAKAARAGLAGSRTKP